MLAAVSLALALSETPADSPRRKEIDAAFDALTGLTDFREAVISPDGRRVAWVEGVKGKGRIQWRPSEGGKAQVITAAADDGKADEGSVAWSPDGKRMAFLSDAAKEGQSQLCVGDVDGGALRALTTPTG